MCYNALNDLTFAIAAIMDVDMITIDTSRSDMKLLDVLEDLINPMKFGPGVYDIHSTNVPDAEWMNTLITRAAEQLPANRVVDQSRLRAKNPTVTWG